MFVRQVLIAMLLVSILSSGCTRTITGRAARFDVAGSQAATTQPIRMAGVWKVKVRGHGDDEYHGIAGSERYLQAGDVVGFRTGDDGVVYAVANKEEFPLPVTPAHRRVVWHARVEEPTDFGRGVGDAAAASGDVARGALLAGVVGGLLWLALTKDDDDDCCRRHRYCERHDKRH